MKNFSKSSSTRQEHFDEITKYMPLQDKILYAKEKIKEFFEWCLENKIKEVTISFSGGKDSTVLFDLVNQVHIENNFQIWLIPIYAMEITFPSTLKFIRETIANYKVVNSKLKDLQTFSPLMPWNEILKTKGFPIYSKQISVMINRVKKSNTKTGLSRWIFGMEKSARFTLPRSRLFLLDDFFLDKWKLIDNQDFKHFFSEKCCDNVKGSIKHDNKPSFVGTLALESQLRKSSWIKKGCNVLNKTKPLSRPLSIWNEKNIWDYIKQKDLNINPAYNYKKDLDYEKQNFHFKRLGCTSCPFGSHIEELKFRRLGKKNFEMPDDINLWNRYEILKENYPAIYQSQVHGTKIYRILIDMDITIKNDPQYMEMYFARRNQIKEWNNNICNNFLSILFQIESYKNNKELQYSAKEFNKAMKHYKIDCQEMSEAEMKKKRKDFKKNFKQKNV